jgi:hypothetical protein
MRIIGKERFTAAQEREMKRIDDGGWNSNDGQNQQWYSLYYHLATGIVKLSGENSGSCYGDYNSTYYASPKTFASLYDGNYSKDWRDLLGDIDEGNAAAMEFVEEILGED